MALHELSDAQLVERAVRNAAARITGALPRWAAVSDTFGLGSTYAKELCRAYGLDPDEKVSGAKCMVCEP